MDNFNPRPPRGGRRASTTCHADCKRFQSTPSARRATDAQLGQLSVLAISIHALREEGDLEDETVDVSGKIFQSTPSARRATATTGGVTATCKAFQSTPSARRATLYHLHFVRWVDISIHALREEGDLVRAGRFHGVRHFNPRPPRGGRPSPCQRPPAL